MSYKVPKVLLLWPEGKSCVYRCINMKPGLHLLTAKLGNSMVSRLVNVPSDDFRATINFTIDAGAAGALEVMLPSTDKHNISIHPAWNTNQFDWKKEKNCPESVGVPVESEPGDTSIAVADLLPGKYKVKLWQTDTTAPYPGLRKNKFVKLWIIDIKPGKITGVR